LTRRLRGLPPTASLIGDEGKRSSGDFWALRDVGFEVQPGEVVGIIGRNGAGKSTLLKILARVTKPTTGTVELRGRVGSLLEVGTGFHPELTGRENVYMNGTLLGMSKREVARRFDEIVDFAGVDQFIDTPVKRYSSGMRVRLGFAVAAHLEPEILIIDEVLAVGDQAFQDKCFRKIQRSVRSGQTTFLVSHNLAAIRQLCELVIELRQGRIRRTTRNASEAIAHYLADSGTRLCGSWTADDEGSPEFDAREFRLVDRDGKLIDHPVDNRHEAWVEIAARVSLPDPLLTMGYVITRESGETLYWSYHTDSADAEAEIREPGTFVLRSRLPVELLNVGRYRVELIGGIHNRKWLYEPASSPAILDLQIDSAVGPPRLWGPRPTLLSPILKWERAQG
jgi:lipopolysaccharide transport system ATP-binding protein